MTIFCKKLSTLIQICCDIMDFLFINKLNLTDFNIQSNRKDFIYGLVNKSHVRNFLKILKTNLPTKSLSLLKRLF